MNNDDGKIGGAEDLSSIPYFKGCIEESIDQSEPNLTVTERYYTPFYKLDKDRERRNDLCLLVHSNRIALVGLAPSHPLVARQLDITAINCEVSKSVDRKSNKAVGKSKKGGQHLEADSILCYLESGEAKYSIEAIAPGKLICMNSAVLKNPNLARLRPDSEGHIAICLPYLGLIQETKDGLLTKEAYEEVIKAEG